jgi:hypothetical protein
MFRKYYRSDPTSVLYEKSQEFGTITFYYTIADNFMNIDEDYYLPYLDWISAGNTPIPTSGERFTIIVDNSFPSVVPNKAAILAQEQWNRDHPDPTNDERIAACESWILNTELGI